MLKQGTPRPVPTRGYRVVGAMGKDGLDGNADRLGSGDAECGKGIWWMGRGWRGVVGRVAGDAVGADRAAGNAVIPYPGWPFGGMVCGGERWRLLALPGCQVDGEVCQLLCDFGQGLGSGVGRWRWGTSGCLSPSSEPNMYEGWFRLQIFTI